MIIYSVTVTIDTAVETEWLDWMQRVHVPDVLRTGCFIDGRIYKVVDESATEPTYVLQYSCEALSEYERYRAQFASALQKDHTEKFSGRFRASRQILSEVASGTGGFRENA